MTSSNEDLNILAQCLFAFRFCSFLHIRTPLVGVEFNRLVLSDLQILDSQGQLPRGRVSFLGLSSSKPNPGCVLCPLRDTHSGWFTEKSESSVPAADRKTEGKALFFSFFLFFLPHNLSSSPTHSNTWTDSLSLSCLLTLRFIFRACWIQAAYFLRHTHRVHVCAPIYTDTPGMHS